MSPYLLHFETWSPYLLSGYLAVKFALSLFFRLSECDHYKLKIEDLRKCILSLGLTAVLLSNPRNPTGQIIEGEELKALVQMAQELDTTTILDEFYSWYVFLTTHPFSAHFMQGTYMKGRKDVPSPPQNTSKTSMIHP